MQYPRFQGKTKSQRKQFNKEERQKGHHANTCQQPGPEHFQNNRMGRVKNTVNSFQQIFRSVEAGRSYGENDVEFLEKQADYCQTSLDAARQHVEADLAARDTEGSENAGKRGFWFW